MGKVIKPGTTGIYPTPVVLVTCVDDDGKPNIITLAWAGIVCSDPPMVSISIRPPRYSHELILKSGEFVVNMPTDDMALATDYCGIVSGRDVDKFAKTGLTAVPASQVKAPIIKECPVAIECRTKQVLSLGTHDMFIAEVLATHIDEELLDESGKVRNTLDAKPLAYSPLTMEYLNIANVIGKYGYSRDRELELK